MTKKTKRTLKDICFPVPQNFALTTTTPATIHSNETVKKSLFQQTIQAAFQITIPYTFTSEYDRERPYQLVSEEQIEMVSNLFQALQPQDAVEAALAQQFIIVHLQAIRKVKDGVDDRDIKKFELTHSILETLQKYRTKGAQLINVQYNVNQGQIFNGSKVNIKTGRKEEEPITIEGETQ
jgi:hypothetical protein